MTPLIYGISYRATSARPQNTKMYMGIFALLYYIIMGIQSEPFEDWQRRRTEIKDRWNEPVRTMAACHYRTTFEILDTLHRENFMHTVSASTGLPTNRLKVICWFRTKKAKSLPLSLHFMNPKRLSDWVENLIETLHIN